MTSAEKPSPARIAGTSVATLLAVASVAVAVVLTRTAWFRDHDTSGETHLLVARLSVALLPASFVLFAIGVQWLLRRRVLAAIPALVALPAWIASLHATRMEVPVGAPSGAEAVLVNANLLVNDAWLSLVLLQMQGIRPFEGA